MQLSWIKGYLQNGGSHFVTPTSSSGLPYQAWGSGIPPHMDSRSGASAGSVHATEKLPYPDTLGADGQLVLVSEAKGGQEQKTGHPTNFYYPQAVDLIENWEEGLHTVFSTDEKGRVSHLGIRL